MDKGLFTILGSISGISALVGYVLYNIIRMKLRDDDLSKLVSKAECEATKQSCAENHTLRYHELNRRIEDIKETMKVNGQLLETILGLLRK
jgi:hypothetical protein